MDIDIRQDKDLPEDQVIRLFREHGWSSADHPSRLLAALRNSHTVVSAWDGEDLLGLANAISDGSMVVYYPYLLVRMSHQRLGVGRQLIRVLQERYDGFHQQALIADANAIPFYEACGFVRAGKTEPMWIYAGTEH